MLIDIFLSTNVNRSSVLTCVFAKFRFNLLLHIHQYVYLRSTEIHLISKKKSLLHIFTYIYVASRFILQNRYKRNQFYKFGLCILNLTTAKTLDYIPDACRFPLIDTTSQY